MDDNDLEKSLREILPSEGHRKKLQSENLMDTSARTDTTAGGELCLCLVCFELIQNNSWLSLETSVRETFYLR